MRLLKSMPQYEKRLELTSIDREYFNMNLFYIRNFPVEFEVNIDLNLLIEKAKVIYNGPITKHDYIIKRAFDSPKANHFEMITTEDEMIRMPYDNLLSLKVQLNNATEIVLENWKVQDK